MSIAQPPAAPPVAAEQLVTASDLVRHFGVWQDRAARAPVYILHRGRPRLALTSLEILDTLCHPAAPDREARISLLMDSLREAVVLVDQDLRVTAASRGATGLLGAISPGMPADRLACDRPAIDAIARVVRSGVAEPIESRSTLRTGQHLAGTVEPFERGALLQLRDTTEMDAERDRRAWADAIDAAFAANAQAARARIGLRGYLEQPDATLAALTGIPQATLATTRLTSLVDITTRVAVGDAIEATVGTGTPRDVAATLLVARADAIPVRLTLAPIRAGIAVAGVAALIVRTSG